MADPAKSIQADNSELDETQEGEIEHKWTVEIRRRIAEIDAGTARLVAADEVRFGIRKLIEDHRND